MSWRRTFFTQLRERNRAERDSFAPVFASYTKMLTQNHELHSRNVALEQAVKLGSGGGGGHGDGGGGVSNAAHEEAIKEMEQKLMTLQTELTDAYKKQSEHSATMLRMREKAGLDEEALLQKEEELAAKQNVLVSMQDDGRGDRQRVKQLEATVELLRQEVVALKAQIAACEQNIKTLTDENKVLVDRLLELKESQASEMNDVNNMYETLLRKTQAAEREQKDAASAIGRDVNFEDTASIMDAVAWQANFNVVLPSNAKRIITAHDGQVTSLNYNANGTLLVSGGTDTLVKIWDARTGTARATLRGAKQSVMHVDFSVDEALVLAVGNDKCGYLWSMKTSRIVHTLTGHSHKIYAGAFSLDGEKVVTGSHDRTIRLWNVSNGYSVRTIPCKSSVNYLAVSPNNGNMVASAHLDKCVRFWSLNSGEMVHECDRVHTQQATCVAFSNDGTLLVTNSRDNTLHLIDVRTYAIVRTFSAVEGMQHARHGVYRNPVNWSRVVFSPDAQYVIAGSACGRLFAWDVQTGKLKKSLVPCDDEGLAAGELENYAPAVCVAWNRNGAQVASCDGQGHVILWQDDEE